MVTLKKKEKFFFITTSTKEAILGEKENFVLCITFYDNMQRIFNYPKIVSMLKLLIQWA